MLVYVVHLPWYPKVNFLVASNQPKESFAVVFSCRYDSLLLSLQAHFSLLVSLFNLKYPNAWLPNVVKDVLENVKTNKTF